MNKSISASILAGKLAVGVPYAYSADGNSSELTLDQIGVPSDIITVPSDSAGLLHVNFAGSERIDFLINGIQIRDDVHVFLAFSKSAGYPGQWPLFTEGHGQLELESESLELLAGLKIQPAIDLGISSVTPLGESTREYESIIVPVTLSDLSDIGSEGDVLFFQAVVAPLDAATGEILWNLAQASEVDKFIIDKSGDLDQEPEPDTGGK